MDPNARPGSPDRSVLRRSVLQMRVVRTESLTGFVLGMHQTRRNRPPPPTGSRLRPFRSTRRQALGDGHVHRRTPATTPLHVDLGVARLRDKIRSDGSDLPVRDSDMGRAADIARRVDDLVPARTGLRRSASADHFLESVQKEVEHRHPGPNTVCDLILDQASIVGHEFVSDFHPRDSPAPDA